MSDSSGVATLTGGTLTDKTYGTSYGAFGTPGGQGTFAFPLTWAELNQAHAISFPAGGSETRVVTAEFFDNQSRTASQDLSLTLACSPATDAACSGTCKDVATDVDNCGTCGTTCSTSKVCEGQDAFGCICSAGKCAATEEASVLGGSSCTAVCAKVGGTCVANTCANLPTGAEGQTNNQISCAAADPFLCCCE